MEQIFSFQMTPLNPETLYPQVSRALEKRTELISRQKCPKMWKLTDKLNDAPKAPQAVQEKRKKRRTLLGLINWVLGSLLLMAGITEPQNLLIPLLVGAVGFGSGVAVLWRSKRTLLGVLSFIVGAIFCIGALGNPAELGGLLVLGVLDMGIGVAALLTRKRQPSHSFHRAARQLLQKQGGQREIEKLRVSFAHDGMNILQEGKEEEICPFPYSEFDFVLETEELLLPIYHDSITILQKKDLVTGTIPELREFLGERVSYIEVK